MQPIWRKLCSEKLVFRRWSFQHFPLSIYFIAFSRFSDPGSTNQRSSLLSVNKNEDLWLARPDSDSTWAAKSNALCWDRPFESRGREKNCKDHTRSMKMATRVRSLDHPHRRNVSIGAAVHAAIRRVYLPENRSPPQGTPQRYAGRVHANAK